MENLDGFLIVVNLEKKEWEDSIPLHDTIAGVALALQPVTSEVVQTFSERCLIEVFVEDETCEEPSLFDSHDPRHREVVNAEIAYALERRARREMDLCRSRKERKLWGLADEIRTRAIRSSIERIDAKITQLEKSRDEHLACASNLRKKARRMFKGVERLWLGKSLSVGNS